MFHKFLKTLAFLTITGTVAGCASGPRQTFPEVTFIHLPGINMAVSQVDIDRRFVSPMTAPHVEHRVPLSPQSVMERWPGDRIVQSGGDASVRYIIVDASVREHALDTDGNVSAIFTNEQALRYEAAAEAILEVASNNGSAQGNVRVRVTRSVTIPENATLNERDQVLFDLIASLMQDFDYHMEKKVRAHLGTWLP